LAPACIGLDKDFPCALNSDPQMGWIVIPNVEFWIHFIQGTKVANFFQ
jgi:hypothetical protein